MDVGDSMLLGQHALAYVVATYGAQVLRVRVLAFPILEQTLHVLGLFIGATVVVVTGGASVVEVTSTSVPVPGSSAGAVFVMAAASVVVVDSP